MKIVPRLVHQFVPSNYKLSITLNRPKKTFNGTVIINGISKNTNEIILHSKDLKIDSVKIDNQSAEYSFGDNDELIIKSNIKPDNHILTIVFSGKITDSMHGLYPCYYTHDGVKKELLATQFESHHAREVFPCIDEPAAKATFDITLNTETNVTVLGNMPIKKQTNKDNNLVTTFETTPIMSSYLVAWVVGELHKKTAYTKSGVEVNVWATPAQPSNSLDFALDIATRTIDFFDDYFGIAYPLPKCDHVALPDFSSGAMENWGLITYREVVLLAYPGKTSISTKQRIATVIAHELSHQWFGNLVTMEWWNDLWLNESFASLIEYTAIDALEPNWNIWLDFASYDSISALRRDSLAGVQPVQTDVNHPDEISTLFDGAIVYCKGARLLQMLQSYIGDDLFRAGLKKYFQIYAYKNTRDYDLWSVFNDVSGKDISSLMNSWIAQPGFPVLRVASCDNQIILSQERLASKSNKKSNAIWPIPLNSNFSCLPELLDLPELIIDTNNVDTSPLQLNIDSKVHFITHYSTELLNRLITHLQNNKLSTIDRLQLLNEQTLLARAGIIESAQLIPLLDAFKNETTEAVWDIIGLTISELQKFVEIDKKAEQKLRQLAGSLAMEQYKRLGLAAKPNEPETDTKLRVIIIGLMLYSENQEVISSVTKLFNSTKPNELDPDLRGLIISTAVRHSGDSKLIDSLLKVYKNTTSAELQQDITSGLTSTKDNSTIQLILGLLKDKSTIRSQDVYLWIVYMMRNKYARELTWQWIQDNWNWIEKTFGSDKSYEDFPRYIAGALSTPKQLKEYRDFFIPLQSIPALSRAIKIGINEIREKVKTIKRDGPSVRKALLDL